MPDSHKCPRREATGAGTCLSDSTDGTVHCCADSTLSLFPAPHPGWEYQRDPFPRNTPEESDGIKPYMKTGLILTFWAGIIISFHLFSTRPGMPGLSTLITFSQ